MIKEKMVEEINKSDIKDIYILHKDNVISEFSNITHVVPLGNPSLNSISLYNKFTYIGELNLSSFSDYGYDLVKNNLIMWFSL